MEAFINQRLIPTETCIVCTEPFSRKHNPVALQCNHIFGHTCIKKWLHSGSGNTNSCPFCRRAIFEHSDPEAFNTAAIWKALCEQPPERLHDFIKDVWTRVQRLWLGRLSADFATSELLEKTILPALRATGAGRPGPFTDALDFIKATWESLGRPERVSGLPVPLVRLARLMAQASSVLPKWLTSVERMNLLLWNANACLGLTSDLVNWTRIIEAAKLSNPRYFPLLHLYTVLISQNLAHLAQPREWPTRRHEVMNMVVERCCRKIGGEWDGRPTNEFKDLLVVVFEELKRHQLEDGKMSLRGHAGEEHVVTGLWGMAVWRKGSAPKPVRVGGGSPTHARSPRGWGNCEGP